eukprot:CAMPEP_0114972620 /NCGR_PEP_ID=MMETSP0216-20121206/497_1 /TAXON_ID=223996 /ORGANISM="Protocruzia adherens, Strain Boccale" /LENGTH=114 /DNA_ID=CAMNT_0002333015 /DNA_START=139 /DNA_END=483 /DNA_ORIENTATION=-
MFHSSNDLSKLLQGFQSEHTAMPVMPTAAELNRFPGLSGANPSLFKALKLGCEDAEAEAREERIRRIVSSFEDDKKRSSKYSTTMIPAVLISDLERNFHSSLWKRSTSSSMGIF